MVKNTQAIRYLNVFNHFVGLALNVLKLERKFSSERIYIHCVVLVKVKKAHRLQHFDGRHVSWILGHSS